jgi:hypothetical protein
MRACSICRSYRKGLLANPNAVGLRQLMQRARKLASRRIQRQEPPCVHSPGLPSNAAARRSQALETRRPWR